MSVANTPRLEDSPPPTAADTVPPAASEPAPAYASRRSRLWGIARATKDIYLPKLTTSVTSMASGVAARAGQTEYDDAGHPIAFPAETTFTLFPSYTRTVAAEDSPTGKQGYMVSVRGWMWCPGIMSRKNRLVLSLVKQVARYRGTEAAQHAVERLNHDPSLSQDVLNEPKDSDTDSLVSASTASSFNDSGSVDSLIKERLSSFIARSIPRAHLSIVVGSTDPKDADSLVETFVYTDSNGHFDCEVFTPYEPAVSQVSSTSESAICSFQEVTIMSGSGYGIISDIDDTVKLTGVAGDKRELMNKLLVGDISTWNIPPVVAWYKLILSRTNATFHYVSNSPWQLFNLISDYFSSVNLPPGSIHLKQYSGNIIASLMEHSSSRKSKALRKILTDFPQKKFICIGDSGEQDLEAYADLAKAYPGRIAAIFIRAVPNSFSNVDDHDILKELRWMLSDWEKRQARKKVSSESRVVPDLIDSSDSVTSESIERQMKLPPMIPKKPDSLKGNALRRLPPLPERKYLQKTMDPKENGHDMEKPKNLESDPRRRSEAPAPPPPRRRKPPTIDPDSEKKSTHGLEAKSTSGPEERPAPSPERWESPDVVSSSGSGKSASTAIPDTRAAELEIAAEAASGRLFSGNGDGLYGVNDFFELEEIDKRGAMWIQRLTQVLHQLEETDTKLEFFEDSDEKFFEASLEKLLAEHSAK